MNILYIANIRIPTEKAHGIQIMKMCEAFSKIGVRIKLIIPRRFNNIHDDPFKYYSVENNFEIIRLPTLDFNSSRLGFLLQTMVFSLFAGLYAIFHRSYIFYSRDDFILYLLSYIMPKNLCWEAHSNRFNFFIKRVARSCRCIITINNGLKKFFVQNGVDVDSIVVAHDGVSISDFNIGNESKHSLRQSLGIPSDRKIFAYIGKYKTMSKDKGIDFLIRVFPEIKKKYPESFLLLVGINQSEIHNVRGIFGQVMMKEEDYKIVLHVPHNRIISYLLSSDIMVMNYPNIEHYAQYMSPLKMFEYMASGNIIIASRLPSIEEVLNNNNSFLCEPDNIESFLDSVDQVNLYPELVANRIRKSLQDVKKYSWDRRARDILSFIRNNEK